tara:strand:+ start:9368 stop:10156 length:789 start_codon:yes stop_codon:yes gene_type:complete
MELAEKVINENILLHALESKEYLHRHPEQTNFFQYARLTKTINKAVDLLPDNHCKILDLGCGTGYLLLEFLQRGFEITGLDLSQEMIAALKEKIPANLKAKATLISSNASDYLKQKKEVFSLISMSAFLHHLFDYEAVLKATCSALRKGGILLIFFEPIKQPIDNGVRYFFHKLLKETDEKLYRLSMILQGISIPDEKYAVSDFQRRFGGIDMNNVCRILNSEGLKVINEYKYCARRYGIPSFIATRIIKSDNSFDVIAVKE